MKIKILIAFLSVALFITQAHGETNGYFSFAFTKGQEQGDSSIGMFHDVQLGLLFSGIISKRLDYLAEICLKEEAAVNIDQAWVRLSMSDAFNLKMGVYLVPFGQYNSQNRAHQTLLVNTPLNVDFAFPARWKDIGIQVEGQINHFFYELYIGNGLAEDQDLKVGQQFEDNNSDKGVGGRAGISAGQGFNVAYSHYRGKYDIENSRYLVLQGVDLNWVSGGLHILHEYTRGQLENPGELSDGNVEGYFVQVALEMDRFWPVASYQWVKYRDVFHGPGFIGPDIPGEGISTEKTRWTLGIVYFPAPSFLCKLEYSNNQEKGIEQKENVLTVQMALSF